MLAANRKNPTSHEKEGQSSERNSSELRVVGPQLCAVASAQRSMAIKKCK